MQRIAFRITAGPERRTDILFQRSLLEHEIVVFTTSHSVSPQQTKEIWTPFLANLRPNFSPKRLQSKGTSGWIFPAGKRLLNWLWNGFLNEQASGSSSTKCRQLKTTYTLNSHLVVIGPLFSLASIRYEMHLDICVQYTSVRRKKRKKYLQTKFAEMSHE